MPHDRYYIDLPLEKGKTYAITEGEWHHLAHVSRAKVGAPLELVNGRGQLGQARVEALGKRSANVHVEQVYTGAVPKASVILALGMPRKSNLDWVIEKGTELGAAEFWLFPGMRSEIVELKSTMLTRLNHLAIAAMKQSGRLDLPAIHLKPPLLQWKPLEGTLLFGDLTSEAPYLWTLEPIDTLPAVLFIGPEKGFDPREETFLRETLKAKGVRLHPNILRAETAPLVALSLIQTVLKQ